jgi:hypothetical protein
MMMTGRPSVQIHQQLLNLSRSSVVRRIAFVPASGQRGFNVTDPLSKAEATSETPQSHQEADFLEVTSGLKSEECREQKEK